MTTTNKFVLPTADNMDEEEEKKIYEALKYEFVLPTPDNLDELYTEEEQKKIYEALKAKFVLPTPDNLGEFYTEEEKKKIYEALKAEFAVGHPYDNTPHTYCEECDCCIACDCCVCDGEGGQLHECPECENSFSDAQIESGEVVPCVRCDKCFVGECGKTKCDCVFDDEEGESDDSWEPDCCKCGTTTDSKGMGGVEHREDLCGWYCGRCYEYHKTPEPKEHQPTFTITVRRKKTSNQ